jgi:hypothetical protein
MSSQFSLGAAWQRLLSFRVQRLLSSLAGVYVTTHCVRVKVKVLLWSTVSQPVSLGVKPHLGPRTRYLLLSDSRCFFDVGRPLWREDDVQSSPVNCCWPSPAQSFLVSGPVGTHDHIFVLSRLLHIFKCAGFELYTLGTDRTENTFSCSCCIVWLRRCGGAA